MLADWLSGWGVGLVWLCCELGERSCGEEGINGREIEVRTRMEIRTRT